MSIEFVDQTAGPRPMSERELAKLRAEAKRSGGHDLYISPATAGDLLKARDYQANRASEAEQRADDAETESAQSLADLAEVSAERNRLKRQLAALRGESKS